MATDKGFLSIIDTVSKFSEVETLVSQKNDLTRKLKRVRRKLSTYKTKYAFLKALVEAKTSDELESATKDYFKEVGYEKVHWTGKDTEREDVQVWYRKKVYIIECKGHTKGNAKREDIDQLSWRSVHCKGLPEFVGHTLKYIMVMNNQSSFPLNKRDNNPLAIAIKTKLLADKNGLVTTKELVNGFIKLKRKEITFSQFDKKLNQIGLIEF